MDETTIKTTETKKGTFHTFITEILPTALITFLVFGVIFKISVVSGESMLPNYREGDIILLNSLFYTEPERNDVISFKLKGKGYIKRVIAVEGDIVDIDYGSGEVIVNGERIQEDYVKEPILSEAEMDFPQTVPEKSVFVLGDNRNNSRDSRMTEIGMVSIDKIRGKVLFPIHTKREKG